VGANADLETPLSRGRGAEHAPLIVGLGGTQRPHSSSERALRVRRGAARDAGAEVLVVDAAELAFPTYQPGSAGISEADPFTDALRRAGGVVVASPGYHGGISGLIKNALDYVDDLREDTRPYLDGKAVGCIASASGRPATTTTLVALRSVVHALRGWPTPLGVAINSTQPELNLTPQLELVGRQVVEFPWMKRRVV
jgi:FMN reductase